LPSVATRELAMPEDTDIFEGDHSHHIGFFYYRKRGVLFLFVGFMLQLIADLIG
jgi:hypothetical protein